MVNNRNVAGRFAWTLVVVIALCIAFAASAFAQQRAVRPSTLALPGNSNVRVMTRNMDAGTDLGYLLSAPTGDPLAFVAALVTTIAEVDLTDPPARAEQLAQEIAAAAPDVIGLQEATLWDFTDSKGHRTYDQLDLLLDALGAAHHPYRVAVVQTLTDIPVQIPGLLSARFTDRNAILVRADLPPGHLDVLATESHLFQASVPFTFPDGSEAPVPQGWMSADIKVRGARFKFVNTHLMSVVLTPPEAFAYTTYLQMQQGAELLSALSRTTWPIILVGDFNSGAEAPQQGPDKTPTAAMIAGAGFTDAWSARHPGEPGYTWGLYLEDQPPPVLIVPAVPRERIDLIFAFGPVATSAAQTGTTAGSGGVFASDHVGVVAEFALEVGLRATARR